MASARMKRIFKNNVSFVTVIFVPT